MDTLYYFYEDMPTTVLFIKHGAKLPYDIMFKLCYQQRDELARFARAKPCIFFTTDCTVFLRAAGIAITSIDQLKQS